MSNDELNRKLDYLLKMLNDMEVKISHLEQGAKESKRQNRNLQQRISRRKRQVRENMEKVISLIEMGSWNFVESKRLDVPGYTWECIDADGIRIVGVVNEYNTKIKIVFPNETIIVDDKFCKELESVVLPYNIWKEVLEWRERKFLLYGDKKVMATFSPENDYSTYVQFKNKKTSCIYCGKSIVLGNVCEICRNTYRKKRRGIGGYPSSDPNARGSNGNDY